MSRLILISPCPSDSPSQIVSNFVNANPPTILSGSFLNFAGLLSRSEDVYVIWM